MENVNRYDCGNGEGMFDDKTGYWVTHEDYKLLFDKYEKLALTIPVVIEPFYCNSDDGPTSGRCKEQCFLCRPLE